MLKVSNLTKIYGNKYAIKDISFEIGTGEIVGLVGHNGSGKTTTMNILTGYLSPSYGSVTVGGYDIIENPSLSKIQIGYLPEVAPLYYDMTVNEQLQFACGLKSIKKKQRESIILDACQKADVVNVRNRLIKNLSKGYKQRIGLAQALLGNPKLLILDEPTSGLDPKQILEIRQTLKELSKNCTIVLSSHILSEITAVCQRLLILSNGHLVADDKPDDLIEKMSPKGKLILCADGDIQKIKQTVLNIPQVKACRITNLSQEGSTEYEIETVEEADITRQLFFALAEINCPIRKLTPIRDDLEKIFMMLTQDKRYENGEGI